MGTLISYNFPERQYKEITKEIKPILDSSGLSYDLVAWPHISIVHIFDQVDSAQREEIQRELKDKPTFRIQDIDVFEGANTPRAYLVLKLDTPEAFRKTYEKLSSEFKTQQYSHLAPHVSILSVPKGDAADLRALVPDIWQAIGATAYPFKPGLTLIWDNYQATDISEADLAFLGETKETERELRKITKLVADKIRLRMQRTPGNIAVDLAEILGQYEGPLEKFLQWNPTVSVQPYESSPVSQVRGGSGEGLKGMWIPLMKRVEVYLPQSKIDYIKDKHPKFRPDTVKRYLERIDTTILHELTHAYDGFRSDGKFHEKDYPTDIDKDFKKYQGMSSEVNARYAQAIQAALHHKDAMDWDGKLWQKFWASFTDAFTGWEALTPDQQKRVKSRAYSEFWDTDAEDFEAILASAFAESYVDELNSGEQPQLITQDKRLKGVDQRTVLRKLGERFLAKGRSGHEEFDLAMGSAAEEAREAIEVQDALRQFFGWGEEQMRSLLSVGESLVFPGVDLLEDTTYKYHSVQVLLDPLISEKDRRFRSLQKDIAKEDLYPEEELPEAHVTLLYGLTKEEDFFSVRQKFATMPPPKFKIGKISRFDNAPEFDVIKFEIESEDFHKINSLLRKHDNENKYPEYKPHMTIAYVKKGACKELEGEDHPLFGEEFVVGEAEWSHRDGYKLPLPFEKQKPKYNESFLSVVKEAREDLPHWAREYLSKNMIKPEDIREARSEYSGMVYRGLTLSLRDLYSEFGRFIKVGETVKENRDGLFVAASKDLGVARSHAEKSIYGRDLDPHEISIVLSADLEPGEAIIDFEEFEEYSKSKYRVEREVLVQPSVPFVVQEIHYPLVDRIKRFTNPDHSWLYPDRDREVDRISDTLATDKSIVQKYIKFISGMAETESEQEKANGRQQLEADLVFEMGSTQGVG